MKCPIEIVGGGLAGLALGRALVRAGAKVTVFEAGDYPRHRVCGEFICGLRREVADTLALEPLLADARMHRTIAWRWRERDARRDTLPAPARGISRHALDHRLANAFRNAGGELRTRTRIQQTDVRPGRVWASGRRADRDGWMGLKVHCRELTPAADLEFHIAENGYVGLTPVEDDSVNVCGLFRRRAGVTANAENILPAYLRACGLPALAERVAATAIAGTQAAVAAVSFARRAPIDRPVVGDAFAMIPPFTGDGMAMAFESAALALEPLTAYASGACDWEETTHRVRTRMQRRFGRRLALANLVQRLLVQPAGQTILSAAARTNLLPFRLLFRLLH